MKVSRKWSDTAVLECTIAPQESDQKTQTFGRVLPDLSRFTASSVHVIFEFGNLLFKSTGTVLHAAHIRQPCIQNQFKAAVGDQRF